MSKPFIEFFFLQLWAIISTLPLPNTELFNVCLVLIILSTLQILLHYKFKFTSKSSNKTNAKQQLLHTFTLQ